MSDWDVIRRAIDELAVVEAFRKEIRQKAWPGSKGVYFAADAYLALSRLEGIHRSEERIIEGRA